MLSNKALALIAFAVIFLVVVFAFYFIAQSKVDTTIPKDTTPTPKDISGKDLIDKLIDLFKGGDKPRKDISGQLVDDDGYLVDKDGNYVHTDGTPLTMVELPIQYTKLV